MKTSTFGGRRRRLLAAASLSLGLASPLFADDLDLAVDTAPIEVESSGSIAVSWSNQGGCTRTTGWGAEGHPVIDNQPDIGLMVAADHASATATYRFDE